MKRAVLIEALELGPEWVQRGTREESASDVDARVNMAVTAAQGDQAGVQSRQSKRPETSTARSLLATTSSDARAEEILRMDWDALKAAVTACTACPLAPTRNKTVFGVGDEAADWLFVGEGPGAEEDARGEPFVGPAGRLLDNMLSAIGLARGKNVYIANIVKCRPPGNRNPDTSEATQCSPFLQRQIELIRPRLIVALGKVAATNLVGRDASISSLRGEVLEFRGIPLIVTYHPAYLLRSLPEKAKAWEDLCFARDTMQKLVQSSA